MFNDPNQYLLGVLDKYKARDLSPYSTDLLALTTRLVSWANTCYIQILNSGSRAKGTAISLASDVDYLVSLSSECNENSGGLKGIYSSLYDNLSSKYQNVRKQNVSIRINLRGLEVDVTPARKQPGNTSNHNLYVSKLDTWKQTNIQRHITDISSSGRTNEIKLLKVWREINRLEFPSTYLEYLLVDSVLLNKGAGNVSLANNFFFVLQELSKMNGNPLFNRIVDPSNSTNILSDLLNTSEKQKIIDRARISIQQQNWEDIVK